MLLKPLKHHIWLRKSPDLFSLDFPLPDFGFPFASCVIEPQPPEVILTHTMSPIAESLETPIPLTATKIAEMRLVDNSSNPIITSVGKITSAWPGHILDKDNGKYIDWAYAMRLELPMVQLWDYIFDPPPAPHTIYEPCIHCAWTSNKCLACSFIKHAILPSEQKLCMDEEDPVVLWKYLEEHHGGAILVKQV
ncbi:hypothetical protein H2248_002585 [Termitomyces sp. 'cryptogamus']|nr:hypothetical protein H2248_002585 [Termitomyces sp. 'cryptogamus']